MRVSPWYSQAALCGFHTYVKNSLVLIEFSIVWIIPIIFDTRNLQRESYIHKDLCLCVLVVLKSHE